MTPEPGGSARRWRRARWIFFALLGATSLVKGIGFGAVIVLSVVAAHVALATRRRHAPPVVFSGRVVAGGHDGLDLAAA